MKHHSPFIDSTLASDLGNQLEETWASVLCSAFSLGEEAGWTICFKMKSEEEISSVSEGASSSVCSVFFFRFLIWKKFHMNLICITSSKSILLLCRLALWCRGISLEETHSPFIYVKTWPHHGGIRKTYKILFFFITQVFLCHRYIGSYFILISTSKSWSAMVRPYWWGLYLCRWTWRNWAGVQLDIPSLLTSVHGTRRHFACC